MTHLKIQQNNGAVEEVSSTVISKLYDIVRNNTLDSTSDLVGRLHTSATFQSYITYLTDRFDELYIDATKIYIDFEDPEVARILATNWGDGIGLTQLDLVGKTAIPQNNFFKGNTTITSFNELNDFTGITGFQTWAFQGCSNLTSIGLNNIQYTGGETFTGCTSLTGIINLPSVIDIGDSNRGGTFFFFFNITQVNCGPNLNGVGSKSFSSCTSLQSVTGLSNMNKSASNANGSAVNTIPNELFYHCYDLESTDIDYSYIETIYAGAFQSCSELEDTVDLSNITGVWSNAFYNCSKINFTGSTVNIAGRGQAAFYGCDLSNVTVTLNCNCTGGNGNNCFQYAILPSVVTFGVGCDTLKNNEFYGTTGIQSVAGGSNITSIGSNVFEGSSIQTATFNSMTDLNTKVFYNCKSLTTASFTSLKRLSGQNQFGQCSALTTFTGGNSLSSVGQFSFNACTSLTTFSPFDKITSIGQYGFCKCPLTSSTVNLDMLTSIDGFAFSESKLTSVSAPLLTEIAGTSFYKCTSLTTANFPSATAINGEAFRLCSSLSSFTGFSTVETIGSSAFMSCSSLTGSISLPNCTSIGSQAFSGTKLTSITTGSITTTTYLMFGGISTLQSLTMNGLTTIPSGTSFLANSFNSLTHLSFPDLVSAQAFGSHADDISIVVDPMPDIEVFKNHLDFKKLDLGPNLTTLGEGSPAYWSGVTIIRATTVPTLTSGNLNSPIAGRIYVPDAALSDYRTAWSGTASKIFPISQFATDYPNDIT